MPATIAHRIQARGVRLSRGIPATSQTVAEIALAAPPQPQFSPRTPASRATALARAPLSARLSASGGRGQLAQQQPRFSPPVVRLRPTRGVQLYAQRQAALRSGQLYTRLSPSSFSDQWYDVTGQPTYQDWLALLQQEARAVAAGQGNNRLEVMLGDSLGLWLPVETLPRDRLWLNHSISGETTGGIVRRLAALENTRPTTIHLLAGANDLKNGVPEAEIANNVRLIVRQLQQQHPQARIVLYSVLPTRRADIPNNRVRSLNAVLLAIAQHERVEYQDLHSQFLDPWGYMRSDLTTDGLHLNADGYAIWQQVLAMTGRRLLA
jgi:lysophospholipase L1-like esterase